MILFINACVRKESRTKKIAYALLNKLGEYKEVDLTALNILPLDEEKLNKRTLLIEQGNYNDEMFDLAKQFANATTIVIAAPFWDYSFPAILKTYFENIFVTGIVSKFSEEGMPIGLCSAQKLYYVTTAGGVYVPNYSYDYVKGLSTSMFGIKETKLIFAENLDITGNNPTKIIDETIRKIEL